MRRIVFFWNEENRLTVAEKANEKKVEFVYDGNGRMRIVKTYNWISDAWVLDSEKHLAYDGNLIIAELDGTDTLVNSYLWGLSLSGGIDGAGGVGGLLIADMNGTKEFPAYDGNGNVTAYTDSSGNILSRQLYSPFGALVSKEGTSSSPFLFSTIYYEPNTELYCYLYRKYIPSLARWLNRDPIGERGGDNLYEFAYNDGIGNIDNLGKESTYKGDSSYYIWLYLHQYFGGGVDVDLTQGPFIMRVRALPEIEKLVDETIRTDVLTKLIQKAKCDKKIRVHLKGGSQLITAPVTHPELRLSLQRFTVKWFAKCYFKKKCDFKGADGDCYDESKYACKIYLTGYDEYDFAKWNPLGWYGHIFNTNYKIRFYWTDAISGKVKRNKTKGTVSKHEPDPR